MSRNLLPAVEREKSYQPVSWTSRHRTCVALEMSGLKNCEIAKVIGWSEAKVSVTLNDSRAEIDRTDFAGLVADKVTDVRMKLDLISHEAVQEAVEIMRDSPKDDIRLRAAFGLLDRAGYSGMKINVNIKPDQVPTEIVDVMSEVMDEMRNHSHTYTTPDPEYEEEEDEEDIDSIEEVVCEVVK